MCDHRQALQVMTLQLFLSRSMFSLPNMDTLSKRFSYEAAFYSDKT
jgi:hypothetical protein